MTFHHLSFDYLLGIAVWIGGGIVALIVLLKLRRRWKSRQKLRFCTHFGLSLWFMSFLLTLVEFFFATIYDESDSFKMTLVANKWFILHVEPDEKTLKFEEVEKVVVYRDDREFPLTVKPDQSHICFIGDSFAFGHGVPNVRDRFSNRIRNALEEEAPGKFLVSNLSNAGQNLSWVEIVLKALFADKRRIDAVVYVMCLNDIEIYHPDRDKLYQKELPKFAPKFFLFRHSYFLNFLYFRINQHTHPQVRDYYSFVRDYYEGPPWETMKRKISSVRGLCRRNDSEFRVAVFPFLHNLGKNYPFRGAHKKAIEFCKVEKIPVIDLDPVLVPHVSEGLTVNRFDAHPNERAHELAAIAIRKKWFTDVAVKAAGGSDHANGQ